MKINKITASIPNGLCRNEQQITVFIGDELIHIDTGLNAFSIEIEAFDVAARLYQVLKTANSQNENELNTGWLP